MLKKIKAFFGALTLYFAAKIMKFLYGSDIKAIQDQLKTHQPDRSAHDIYKKEAAALPADQRKMLNHYAQLQNEIFKAFLQFSQEIQKSSGPEMDGVAQIWATTVLGLNKTITQAFSHPNDTLIKQHLAALDKELELSIATNQEIIGVRGNNGGPGGFGYNGPIGEA